MERLTPVELDNVRLRKGWFGGYRRAETDDLLGRANRALSDALLAHDALKNENAALARELEGHRAQEAALRDALLFAQRAADEVRAAAQKSAEATLETARQQAMAERMDLQRQLQEIRWDIERAKDERRRFEGEMQDLLARYRRDVVMNSEPPLALT